MSPIINSFLRPMGRPTWYNQDGAIRTGVAIYRDSLRPDAFRAWSLQVFIWPAGLRLVRVLIWLDHMGLRVATLVNLSFIGGDLGWTSGRPVDGPLGPTRVVPEGIRRFAPGQPSLIPFYIPRGAEWEQVWTGAEG